MYVGIRICMSNCIRYMIKITYFHARLGFLHLNGHGVLSDAKPHIRNGINMLTEYMRMYVVCLGF